MIKNIQDKLLELIDRKNYTLEKTTQEKDAEILKLKSELNDAYRQIDILSKTGELVPTYSELIKASIVSSERLNKYKTENKRIIQENKEQRVVKLQLIRENALLKFGNRNVNLTPTEYSDIIDIIVEDDYKDITTSSEYMDLFDKQRKLSKALVKSKKACICETEWTINGSKSQGNKMVRDMIKLSLMIFDTIVDRACTYVRYSNYEKWKLKVVKAFDTVNKLFIINKIVITDEYLKSKLKELDIMYKFQKLKQEEKEKTKEIRKKALEEKREKERIEKEQAQLEQLLRIEEEKQRERDEANKVIQLEMNKTKEALELLEEKSSEAAELQEKIKQLEQQLEEGNKAEDIVEQIAELEAKKEVLQSGFVYIISNYGAFGENVFKIGVTRRADPLERINELGNASVPFRFNVHAIIPSDEAFKLEYEIHKVLRKYRVNLVNNRKEFFKIDMEQLISILNDLIPDLLFDREITEEQYIESNRIKNNPEEFDKWLQQIEDKYNSDDEEDKQLKMLGILDTSILENNANYKITEQYEMYYNKVAEVLTGLSSNPTMRVTKYYMAVYLQLDSNMKKLCTFYKSGDGSNIFSFSIQGYSGDETKGTRASMPISLFNSGSNYDDILLKTAVDIDNELTDLVSITGIDE